MTISRRTNLADLLKQDPSSAPQAGAEETPTTRQPIVSGALRAMGLQLEQMSAEASETRELKSKIASGDQIVSLDPALFDPSFISDRIAIEDDPDFDAFVASIAERGQQIPILARPHPSAPNRYQVAYGHRRLKAAARLSIQVRAIIRPMTDVELVIAQTKENLDRQDLSYIERALLARQLEEKKFERPIVMSALSVDKADLSRLLSLAAALPVELVRAIGPAPKIGRPRWHQLAELLKETAVRKQAMKIVAGRDFVSSDTNERFAILFRSLRQPAPRAESDEAKEVRTRSGQVLARIDDAGRQARLLIDSAEFKTFLLSRLPDLVAEFEQEEPAAAS
jgi:ParB family chromosome partitioning protein